MTHQKQTQRRIQKQAATVFAAGLLLIGVTGCNGDEPEMNQNGMGESQKPVVQEETTAPNLPKPNEVYMESLKEYEAKEEVYRAFLNEYDEFSGQAIPRDDFKGMLKEAIADNVVNLDENEVLNDMVEVMGDYSEYASKTKEAHEAYIKHREQQLERVDTVGESAKADRIDFDTKGHLAAAKEFNKKFSATEQGWLNQNAAETMEEIKTLVNGLSDEEWEALEPRYVEISEDFYDTPEAMLSLFADEVDTYRAVH